MHDPALIRTVGLFGPLLAGTICYLSGRPIRGVDAGAVLSSLWNLPALLLLHALAQRFDWWSYDAEGGLLMGMPVDLYLGWAVLWGAIPCLAFPYLRLGWVMLVMLSVDLLFMPLATPVVRLGDAWLFGEAAGLVLCLAPA